MSAAFPSGGGMPFRAQGGRRGLTKREWFASWGIRLLPIRNGKHRVLDFVLPLLGSPPVGLRNARCGAGYVSIDASDLVGRHFLMLRSFDPEVVDALAWFATMTGGNLLWDIGANKGTFTYQFIQRFPSMNVVAVEPQRDLAPTIRENLSKLHRGRFEVFDVAVGMQHGEMTLTVPNGNRGAATLDEAGERNLNQQTEIVEVVPAETLVQRSAYGWPTIVKIDVEGYEAFVIDSMRGALQAQIPSALAFEHRSGDDERWSRISRAFGDCGYKIFAIRRNPWRTWLDPVQIPTNRANDYVAARGDLVDSFSGRITVPRGVSPLIRSKVGGGQYCSRTS